MLTSVFKSVASIVAVTSGVMVIVWAVYDNKCVDSIVSSSNSVMGAVSEPKVSIVVCVATE